MFERLFAFMFEKKEKVKPTITVVRKEPRFNADACAVADRRDFISEKERADFFRAAFYSRYHI